MASKHSDKNISAVINGIVIDPAGNYSGKHNIFIKDGLISEISDRAPGKDDVILDAAGFHVSPGFIDMHVHLRDPGFEHKEDIESGSRAAIAGGFTTILCMPNTNPPNDCADVTKYIIDKAKKVGLVNVLPVGAMTIGLKGEELADYDSMLNAGAIALSDDGACIQDYDVAKMSFNLTREKGTFITSHPEITLLNDNGVVNEGAVSKRLNLPGIPRAAENEGIKRDIELSRDTGARLHLGHVSTKEGIEYVRAAKLEGLNVTCEVTPHHLFLTDEDVEKHGANAKMNPPLRTKDDCRALIDGIIDGTVDAIATDHAPHAPHEKTDLLKSPFGIIGLETAFPVCMKLVEDEEISIEHLVELFSTTPAKLIGMKSGKIEKGWKADLTVLDLGSTYPIDHSMIHSKSQNSPYIGLLTTAKIMNTIVAGSLKILK